MQGPHAYEQVNRRTILVATFAIAPFILTRAGQAGTKVSQPAAHYQATPKDGQECGACAHFAAPGACKLVDGEISATGWCRLWTKRSA